MLLPVLAVATLAGCALGGGDDDGKAGPKRPPPGITRAELKENLAALQDIADRNGGTRAAGTPGYDQSADYVAARLKDAGWTVTRQPVPFTFFELHSASLTIGGHRLTRADDFQVYSYSGSGTVEGRLETSGLGCAVSDYDGLDPGEIPLTGRGECFTRVKAEKAERAGAKALVVQEDVRSRRGVPSGTLVVPGIRIPVVVVSTRAIGKEGGGSQAKVSVDATSTGGRTENVIAETPGGSADHVVMAGGHLDSVRGGPGIDDNGSGVAALIEAAEAIGPTLRARRSAWGSGRPRSSASWARAATCARSTGRTAAVSTRTSTSTWWARRTRYRPSTATAPIPSSPASSAHPRIRGSARSASANPPTTPGSKSPGSRSAASTPARARPGPAEGPATPATTSPATP